MTKERKEPFKPFRRGEGEKGPKRQRGALTTSNRAKEGGEKKKKKALPLLQTKNGRGGKGKREMP